MATPATSARPYTSKQMGDACEMLVAAELTLAGIPALKMPDNWPGYDVIAQRKGSEAPLRISVKSRTYSTKARDVSFSSEDHFEWLAIVLLECDQEQKRRVFLIPAEVALRESRKNRPTTKHAKLRYWRLDEVPKLFSRFENNFKLLPNA